MPKISVIIPFYGRSNLLKRAIKSVLDQTFQNFEIIIIDDNDPGAYKNKTKKIIEIFNDKRIRFINHNKNKGNKSARNTGLNKAKGEYIAFLDDDEWLPNKIEKQIKAFNDPKIGLVVCYSLDKIFGMERISKPHKRLFFKGLLKSFNLSSTSSYIVKEDVINKIF